VLECLGRWHDPASVIRGVELVGDEDFASFNVDLIYGATAESDDDWRRTLDAVLELSPRPPHVSAYGLTVEPGTALWRDPERHPDDDVQAGRYETADAVLRSAGLDWYEVSNWSVAGHGCRHNALYWGQDDYRGFGCAAHSHRRGNRFWNIRTPERYIAAVTDAVPGAVRPALAGEELLGAEERRFESLELALRTRGGVPRDALAGAMAAEPALAALLEPRGERLVLTLAGRLLANEVAIRLDTSERSPTASAGTRSEMC